MLYWGGVDIGVGASFDSATSPGPYGGSFRFFTPCIYSQNRAWFRWITLSSVFELELKLIKFHMIQKKLLRGEVDVRGRRRRALSALTIAEAAWEGGFRHARKVPSPEQRKAREVVL